MFTRLRTTDVPTCPSSRLVNMHFNHQPYALADEGNYTIPCLQNC